MLQGYENLEVSYSLQELWISMLIAFYCKRSFSDECLNVPTYEYKDKYLKGKI